MKMNLQTDNRSFVAGDLVQVRSKEEILASLDKNGQLEALPFMPEMFNLCGKQFRVFRRAHKTCDPPNGLRGRRMPQSVHLEGVRCNGEAHGGCQARCLIFWKETWLKRVEEGSGGTTEGEFTKHFQTETQQTTEEDVLRGTRRADPADPSRDPVYVCQSTQIEQATLPLSSWDWRQYLEDYTSGNVSIRQLLIALFFFLFSQLVSAGLGFGSVLRYGYDYIQKRRGATPYPMRVGKIVSGKPTPAVKLNVQPGELVRIRSYKEVLATLDENGLNRGMWFDAEMVPYCGGTYRVLDRIEKIINEKTGKMIRLKNDCIMLDNVVCRACYSKYRRFCPRSIYPFWREVWLDRATDPERSLTKQESNPAQ
jgi:hypothetical protein